MFDGVVGTRVYFIGEERDLGFFAPMHLAEGAPEIARVPLTEAEGIVCTGPFDPHADPAVNRPDFLYAKTKGLKLLCANPDIVVDRGDSREWCAGALAALYTEMGGESLYFGKPHPPVYDLARRRLAEHGAPVAPTAASSPSATASAPTSRARRARTSIPSSSRAGSPRRRRRRRPARPGGARGLPRGRDGHADLFHRLSALTEPA
jgi:hypothetical protein